MPFKAGWNVYRLGEELLCTESINESVKKSGVSGGT